MSPELFELPRIAQELADVNRAERERVATLAAEQQATRQEIREGFAQVDRRFDQVDQQFAHVDERFDRVETRLGVLEVQGRKVTNDTGQLKGELLEDRIRRRARTFFRSFVEQPVAVSVDEFDAFVDQLVENGQLLPAEAGRLGRADLLVRGRTTDAMKYLVIEISWSLDEDDVVRAADRAAILRKAGYDAQGVIAGRRIQPSALAYAERVGIPRMIEREMDGKDPTGEEDE